MYLSWNFSEATNQVLMASLHIVSYCAKAHFFEATSTIT